MLHEYILKIILYIINDRLYGTYCSIIIRIVFLLKFYLLFFNFLYVSVILVRISFKLSLIFFLFLNFNFLMAILARQRILILFAMLDLCFKYLIVFLIQILVMHFFINFNIIHLFNKIILQLFYLFYIFIIRYSNFFIVCFLF